MTLPTESSTRIIVYGSRHWTDRNAIRHGFEMYAPAPPATVVHGACRGADKLAADIAMRLGYDVEAHPANWVRHGKAAGPIRNQEIVDLGAKVAIGFGDGKGTADMTKRCIRAGINTWKVMV